MPDLFVLDGQTHRDFRFVLPDEFAELTDTERTSRLDGDDTFLRVDSDRYFLRAIVPIQLLGGHPVAYAVWIETDLEVMRAAYDAWDEPDYAELKIHGAMANALPPWSDESSGTRVVAEVRHLSELPYVVASPDGSFAKVLDSAWEHQHVLATFPS